MKQFDSPIDIDALLGEAARQILRHEDPARLAQWLVRSLPSFMAPEARSLLSADGVPALASNLARAIWNATPLPGNHFRPAPLPAPGRNDPCPCGSGLKFKRCCANAPRLPEISKDVMWPHLMDAMPRAQVTAAAAAKQIPVASLAEHAADLQMDGNAERAVDLLEPLFESAALDTLRADAYGFALDILMNALDDLGEEDRKRELVDRVTREAARSVLRAAAWQRLATILIDEGDSAQAWKAFQAAQRDDPDSTALAHLEILLLMADERVDDVPQRARDWARRLLRRGFTEDDGLIEWLRDVERDPVETLAELGITSGDEAGSDLYHWISTVRDRPLPRHRYCEDAPPPLRLDDEEAVRSHFRQMGLPFDAARQVPDTMGATFDAESDPDEGEDGGEESGFIEPPSGQHLAGPADLTELERQWHEVFEGVKPFATGFLASDEEAGLWNSEPEWCEFLAAHPEAFDSLDILDDLVTTVMSHPMFGDTAFDQDVLQPLVERAVRIVENAVSGVPGARLSWALPQNRPALRPLVYLSSRECLQGDGARGLALAELAMALNPDDQHGVRQLLMEQYLKSGRDRDALALAEAFSEDMLADTAWGKVLASFRLQGPEGALAALRDAQARLPRVQTFLLRKRIREPEEDGFGVTIGGDRQAWEYRDVMRDEWERTPGVLAWLKKHPPA